MTKAKFIGKIEEEPYGISFEYQYGNIFSMNRFLLYLIQNWEQIGERLKNLCHFETIEKFISKINRLDEFEVYYFHNTEKIDVKSIDWNKLELITTPDGILLRQHGIELSIDYPIGLDIYYEDIEVERNDFENLNGKIVKVAFDDSFPPLFMTEEQIQVNIRSITEFIDSLLVPLRLHATLTEGELRRHFSVDH